jgi:gamma-glutamylcyclotransferase (GGCT)/AIG2-like uncharacterized protein YtfP
MEPQPLFVYGTLLFGPVLDRVLGRRPAMLRAAAPGFAARTVAGATYPGMVSSASSVVGGVLFLDLSDAELGLLDAYEGEPYRRELISAVDERGSVLDAFAYVVDELEVTSEAWESRAFFETQLEAFVAELDRSWLSEG